MNRVETAIASGRCVLVFGSRALADAEVLGELRIRGAIPATVLSGEAPNPAVALGPEVLAPALAAEGGVICLVEADTVDAQGLATVAAMVQAAPHKPRLVVAARSFNPFLLPTPLRLLKMEQEKRKAKEFLQTLPVPAAAPAAVVAAAPVEDPKKKKASGAPRVHFAGREEELATFAGLLESGGPIALVGPHGVGRRWLVEKALAGREGRAPDFSIGWGSEADSLYARIAFWAEKAGDDRLSAALRNPAERPAPAALAALAVEMLSIPAAESLTLVIDHLEHVLRRDGTFHREGRLELLLRALLTSSYAARLIFVSTVRPRFYREGDGSNLRLLELGGLKGRELHEVFEAYRVEDFARDNYGPIQERIHGHPFAARLFAVAVRDPETRQDLLDSKKFMVMSSVADPEPVKRRVQKLVDSLEEDEKKALFALAHFRLPVGAPELELVGVDRRIRLTLLAKGLLDAFPDEGNDRQFRVHWLVKAALPNRETSDYQTLEMAGNHYLERASKAEGLQKLALAQEGNRLLFEAHRVRNRMRTPLPDHDPSLESLRGLIRSKRPRLDLAEQRINESLKQDPANTEILLMRAELAIANKLPGEKVVEAFAEAERAAPTPEVFHTEASFHLLKSSGRGRAAACLERGVALFPDNARLRRRLAGVLVDQNRLDEAVEVLKAAMELEPMMPDTYGLLGEVNLLRGPAWFDAAEEALGEARRLDPENALHTARLAALIVERGDLHGERLAQAIELLESAISADSKNYLAHLYLGRLLVEGQVASVNDGSLPEPDAIVLDRADYLLKKAQKLEERAALPLVFRARVATLRKAWADAEAGLKKASQLEPSCHEAFAAMGDLYVAQGHIFPALTEFLRALERSPKEARARPSYEARIAQCKLLIESGAAIDLARQAEEAGIAPPAERVAPAERREPGKTTRRRRKRGKGGEGEATAEGGEGEAAADADGAAVEATGDAGSDDGAATEASAEAADASTADAGDDDAPAADADEAPAANAEDTATADDAGAAEEPV